MPLRNPFARQPRPSSVVLNDENARPPSSSSPSLDAKHPGFERVDTVGSKRSTSTAALSIRSSHSTEEYKMSVVNDSGVYLPPSPVEKEAPTWPKRYLSRQSSEVKREGTTATGEIEHFSISRESFDSYRRSFDISARSPIPTLDPLPRQSLDSQHTRFYSSSSTTNKSRLRPLAEKKVPEDPAFEDVGLNDENRQPTPAPVKKRGFFSKFGSEEQSSSSPSSQEPPHQGITSRLMGHGRKRGQSLTSAGAELAPMPMERAKVEEEVQG